VDGTRPYYDEIHLFPMNMNEGQTAFDAGDLDMARLNSSAIEVAKATAGGAASVSVRRGLDYHWLGMNVESPKLSDIRVRRAIQRAINVAEVTRAVFGDSVAPAFGPVTPAVARARTSKLYNFDPDEARRLLKLAGVKSLNLRLDSHRVNEAFERGAWSSRRSWHRLESRWSACDGYRLRSSQTTDQDEARGFECSSLCEKSSRRLRLLTPPASINAAPRPGRNCKACSCVRRATRGTGPKAGATESPKTARVTSATLIAR